MGKFLDIRTENDDQKLVVHSPNHLNFVRIQFGNNDKRNFTLNRNDAEKLADALDEYLSS